MSKVITPTALQALKLTQLRSIAISLGVASSGTKTFLANTICECLQVSRFPVLPTSSGPKPSFFSASLPCSDTPGLATNQWKLKNTEVRHDGTVYINKGRERRRDTGSTRILSIDMGIRNLAICLLEIPGSSCENTSQSRLIPNILSWERIDISRRSDLPEPQNDITALIPPPFGEEPPPMEKTEIKESFLPPLYSSLAYSLSHSLLTQHKPHQILIERQRFRSCGGNAVQEWTIRVNMFESLLWGCFRTLSEVGVWNDLVKSEEPDRIEAMTEEAEQEGQHNMVTWKGSIESVNPQNVAKLWEEWREGNAKLLLKENEDKEKKECTQYYASKMSKMAIVTELLYPTSLSLENPEPELDTNLITFPTLESQDVASLFSPSFPVPKKASPKKRRRKTDSNIESAGSEEDPTPLPASKQKPKKGKLDDLADCLLQGLAWVKWEEARRILSHESGWKGFGLSFGEEKVDEGSTDVIKAPTQKRKPRKAKTAKEAPVPEEGQVEVITSDANSQMDGGSEVVENKQKAKRSARKGKARVKPELT